MKKVLVLVAAMSLVATSAFALSVTNSKHNLANGSGNPFTGGSAEVCVYCHTPHGASTAGPLWNRTAPAATGVYSSVTFNAPGTASGVDVAGTDAPLCLSCHDGTSITGGLNNEPNSGAVAVAGAWTGGAAGPANLTTDMSNDHPVGFNYAEVQTAEGAASLHNAPALQFFGGEMWCSTCHDVHDNANAPFLVASNAGSGLCLTCHNK